MEPPALDEQRAKYGANLVPLRATCSESVPAVELYDMCDPYTYSEVKRVAI